MDREAGSGSDRRVRPSLVAAAVVLLAVLAAAGALVARDDDTGGSDRRASPVPGEADPGDGDHHDEEPPPTAPGTPVALEEALAELEPLVDALLAQPGVRITATSDLDGQVESFAIDVDAAAGAYASREVLAGDGTADVVTERIETPQALYLRVDDGSGDVGEWNVIPITVAEERRLEASYTLFGRITVDLPELLAMWRAIDASVVVVEADGRRTIRATAPAVRVVDHLRDAELAATVEPVEGGTSTWELGIEGGRLVALGADGVQFFTGEAFDHARIDVAYEPTEVAVSAPAP